MAELDERIITTPPEATIANQMQEFDEWLRVNLDRSFPDEAIVAVFQYHVVQAMVNTGITFEHMMHMIKHQYDELTVKKNNLMADHINANWVKPDAE